jgi:hypothetical protein
MSSKQTKAAPEHRKPVLQMPKYYKRIIAFMTGETKNAYKKLIMQALREEKESKEARQKESAKKARE